MRLNKLLKEEGNMNAKIVTVALLALLACGCASTFQEKHFFKSDTASALAVPNYYRLTIDGYAYFSSSRYISGYFDEDTLNTYFNEYTQPTGAAIVSRSKTDDTKAAAGKQNPSSVEPVAKELKGKQLVMILCSNSDEISTQIGALAASKQFTASLAGLVARDQYTAADAADSRLAVEKSRAKATSDLAKQIVEGLPKDANAEVASKALLGFINTLASDLGHQGVFNKLDDAAQWLQFNRARLLKGDL
jgi:hypothetical protein